MPSDAAAGKDAPARPRHGRADADAAAPPVEGFDITPAAPAKPRPPGLSGAQKGYLALAMIAVLGAVALVADILAAKQGNPPTRGLEHLAEEIDDGGADPSRPAAGTRQASAGTPSGQAPAGGMDPNVGGASDPQTGGSASGTSSGAASGSSTSSSASGSSTSSTGGLPTSLPLTESIPPVP